MQLPHALTERYELEAHLARGGMADVYRGKDGLLGRSVAVKVLHSQLSSDEAFVKRFRKEAQAAANLTHPNIVAIYDWGQFDSTYFIVMELVEGRSLREVLRSAGALLPRRAVEIAAEVAAALSVAHRSGLVHRDIKPGNILLAPDGTVKVTDFGIARAWDDSQELTRTGAVMGTATYFSPEQAQGAQVDERSDVYSLGVVLYEMLTGEPPFRGDSPVSVAYQHVSSEAMAPSAVNPDVPMELDGVVLRAMNKDPEARYQTAEDFRADLWRALSGRAPLVADEPDESPTRLMATTPAPPATVPPDEAYRQLEAPPASNVAFVLGTVALLATLGALIFLVISLLRGPIEEAAEVVTVPELINVEGSEALRRLQEAGLIALPRNEESELVESGRVIRTEPPAGDQLERGASITVFISTGIEQFGVPFLVGLEQSAAEELIRAQGFAVGTITPRSDADRPLGTVLEQNPAANTKLPQDTPIDLVVSSGPESVLLDSLLGLTEREATTKLQTLGLTWELTTEFSTEVERGRIIRTEPEAGTELIPGDVVLLVSSDGPEPIAVPDLFGTTEDAARTRLEELGLVLQVAQARLEVGDPAFVDRVVEQNPTAGSVLFPGEIVVVTLGSPPAPPTTTTTTTAPTTTTSTAPTS